MMPAATPVRHWRSTTSGDTLWLSVRGTTVGRNCRLSPDGRFDEVRLT